MQCNFLSNTADAVYSTVSVLFQQECVDCFKKFVSVENMPEHHRFG